MVTLFDGFADKTAAYGIKGNLNLFGRENAVLTYLGLRDGVKALVE